MASSQREFDKGKKSISSIIDKELSQIGFRKKGNNWSRVYGSSAQVINIQWEYFGNESHMRLTANLGVFIPSIWEACWGKKSPVSLKETDCVVRSRIGKLMGGSKENSIDKWWNYGHLNNASQVADEVIAEIVCHGIPFLNSINDEIQVANFYKKKYNDLLPIEKLYFIAATLINDPDSEMKSELNEICNISNAWSERVSILKSNIHNY